MATSTPENIQNIIYPAPESPTDRRFDDLVEFLQMALERTVKEYGPYKLMPSTFVMNETRYIMEIKNNTGKINVIWSSTSPDKEKDLQAIRISLRKDLLGYRIALINAGKQADIDKIKTLDDLKNLKIGQGRGWGDNAVYRENGISVSEHNYKDLFRMVTEKYIDLFPRGITEVFDEYELNHSELSGLSIEQHLVIYYLWPYYFFTSRKDIVLAQRIEKGLQMMLADGSFEKVFNRHNSQVILKANLKNRRIIQIKNPFLPKDAPVGSGNIQPLDAAHNGV
ncbi:amino acid ABC transporter substrate-binding protein [Chitinimonas sp. BJB300]|nr:amino acid ABC transporter substrate-binding protein [Chitinimonas sp. BJB300]TSJ90194.1 amino acid ABC transporter substrate-binding protein [Chitinimonas sp. BJB300]